MKDAFYIGIDIGGTTIKAGYGNPAAGIVSFSIFPHHNSGRAYLLALLESIIEQLSEEIQAKGSIQGIAVGSPGIISSYTGEIIANCPNINEWQGANPKTYLQQRFGLPVLIENDADLMTLGEYCYTHQDSQDALLGITIGTGIGSGFVNKGRIFHGKDSALELGHTVVEPQGLSCSCGKRGCLEMYSSVKSMTMLYSQQTGKNVTMERLLDLYAGKEQTAVEVVTQAYDKLGLAIANSVMILGANIISIGGGITEIPTFSIEPVAAAVKSYLCSPFSDSVSLRIAGLKNKAGVYGGIMLAERGC